VSSWERFRIASSRFAAWRRFRRSAAGSVKMLHILCRGSTCCLLCSAVRFCCSALASHTSSSSARAPFIAVPRGQRGLPATTPAARGSARSCAWSYGRRSSVSSMAFCTSSDDAWGGGRCCRALPGVWQQD